MISGKNILGLKARRRIYTYILNNPDLHLREISRRMNMPKTTLKHHLKYLEKQDLITISSKNGYKRYCIKDALGRKEKEILNLLRQEVPRNILVHMIFFIACSEIELSKALGKHPSTIAFHLKKLKELGIIKPRWRHRSKIRVQKPIVIKRNKMNNEIIYYFSDGEIRYTIYNLLITYKNSLPGQDFIDELLKLANEITYLDRSKKIVLLRKWLHIETINNYDSTIDTLFERVYEIFPHPYHT